MRAYVGRPNNKTSSSLHTACDPCTSLQWAESKARVSKRQILLTQNRTTTAVHAASTPAPQPHATTPAGFMHCCRCSRFPNPRIHSITPRSSPLQTPPAAALPLAAMTGTVSRGQGLGHPLTVPSTDVRPPVAQKKCRGCGDLGDIGMDVSPGWGSSSTVRGTCRCAVK
jgi:hypothetical protein